MIKMICVCIFLVLLFIFFVDNVKFKDCGKCKLYMSEILFKII